VWLLRGPLDGIDGGHLLLTFVKTLGAAAVMAAVAVGVERWLAVVVGHDRLLDQSICLGVAISTGLVALAATARLLRVREFDEAFALARARVSKMLVS
jgi:hypothetical protein